MHSDEDLDGMASLAERLRAGRKLFSGGIRGTRRKTGRHCELYWGAAEKEGFSQLAKLNDCTEVKKN